MKKKLFGGKLKDPIGFVIALSIISFSSFFTGVLMILVLVSGNYPDGDRTGIGVVAVLSLLFAIGFPILFVHVVKNREKYPCLSKLLVSTRRGGGLAGLLMRREDSYFVEDEKEKRKRKRKRKHF